MVHFIDGPGVDRLTNTLTLTQRFHQLFGDFEVSFEPADDQTPHSYKIANVDSNILFFLRDRPLPVTRRLYLHKDHTIDPPSPRLLAIHHAIARILHLSGAGDY